VKEIQIPEGINVLAIPFDMLSWFIAKKNDGYILVIEKTKPAIEIGCGATRRTRIVLPILTRGGIRLFKERRKLPPRMFGPPRDVDVLARKLRFGEIVLADLNWDKLEKGEVIKPGYTFFYEYSLPQYLVFERINDMEWRVAEKEPQAFVTRFVHTLNSRVECAKIDVIKSTLQHYVMIEHCCATNSVAAIIGIARLGDRMTVRLSNAGYRERLESITATYEFTIDGWKKVTDATDIDVI
jgi:hypothetical protein